MLLSVRPRHAEAILEGRKTVEVRRRPVRVEPGSTVLIYATSPTRAVVGLALAGSTVRANAEIGWAEHHSALAIARFELDEYLDGATGSFISLERATRLATPLGLTDLRNGHRFRPPRSYRYLSLEDPAVLHALASRIGPPATPSRRAPPGERPAASGDDL